MTVVIGPIVPAISAARHAAITPVLPLEKRANRLSFRLLVVIGLMAVLVRLGAIFWLDAVSTLPASAYEHGSIARYLCEGKGFVFHFYGPVGSVVPTSQQAPLMAGMLAGCYQLLGIESRAAFSLALVIQSLAGGLAVVHLARLTHSMFGDSRISLAAGFMGGLGPAWVVAPAFIQAVTWNLLAVAMMIDGVMLIEKNRHSVVGKFLFITSNILAWHVDPIVAATGGVLLFLRLLPRWNVRRGILVVLLIAFGVLPWSLRNCYVHGRPIFIKDSFWYVFWQGNTLASHGTDKLPVSGDAASHRRVSVDETMSAEFRSSLGLLPREIDRMDAFGPLIREELLRRPVQYVEKCFLRLRQWIWFDETNPYSGSVVYRAWYWALITLAVAGLCNRKPKENRGTSILVALGMMSLFSIFIITSARFRLPAEFLLVPWASAGVVGIFRFLLPIIKSPTL